MLAALLPSFYDELEKIAAEAPSFGLKDIRSWADFEDHLHRPEFRKEVFKNTDDKKLKKYTKNVGGVRESKDLHAYVQSSSDKRKDYQIKKLPGGRLGCTCKDWQYIHSVKNTDCKHIKRYKQYLQGKVKESSMDLAMVRGFRDEVEKIAARRGLKEIAKSLKGGDLGRAQRLATTPGVVKPSVAGSQIKHLGGGAEGVASLVAHPQHGVAVRKLYDPAGMSSPAMIARKEQVGRAIGANPNVAQFHGSAPAPGGSTMHFNEYVRGTPMKGTHPGVRGQDVAARQAAAGTQKALRGAGMAGGRDVRMGNMIKTPEGKAKVIDYIPGQRGEFANSSQAQKLTGHSAAIVPKTPAAASLVSGGSEGTPQPALLRSQLSPGRPVKMKNPDPFHGTKGVGAGDRTPPVQMQPKSNSRTSIKMPAGDFL